MIRQDIKAAIKTSLVGVSGVKSIFTARQKLTQNQQTPCITIYLPEVKESAIASGIPLSKRRVEMTALLEVVMVDVNNVPEVGEAAFDDMLDAIDVQLRQNFTLQGVVAGAAIKNLQTTTAAPQLVEGQNVFRVALKKFDIALTVTGINGFTQNYSV